jgi:hypothetical protein
MHLRERVTMFGLLLSIVLPFARRKMQTRIKFNHYDRGGRKTPGRDACRMRF